MRLKDYDVREGKRVWLSGEEMKQLEEMVEPRNEVRAAFILAARCGLRRKEITQVKPTDLVSTDHGRIVRVWDGKGDKYREVPAPSELADLVIGMNRDPDEPLVSAHDSTIYDWVQKAANKMEGRSQDVGWKYLGPHDLRRSWGVQLLESGVLPSVVMDWGGWEDWKTFRNHYLAEFSPEALRRERGKVPWLSEFQGEGEPQDSYAVVQAEAGRY